MSDNRRRNRIVIEAPPARHQRSTRPAPRQPGTGAREGMVALSVIGAAALATFIALFLTSRPYDPMSSTLAPGQTVPAESLAMQPSPKPSPTISTSSPQQNQAAGAAVSPEAASETGPVPDDAGIQSQIERTLSGDPALSKLDISTLVDRKSTRLNSSHRL